MNSLGQFLNQPIVAIVWTGLMLAMFSGRWVGADGDLWTFMIIAGTFIACGFWAGSTFTFKRDMVVINRIIEANHGLAEALDEVMTAAQKLPNEEEKNV